MAKRIRSCFMAKPLFLSGMGCKLGNDTWWYATIDHTHDVFLRFLVTNKMTYSSTNGFFLALASAVWLLWATSNSLIERFWGFRFEKYLVRRLVLWSIFLTLSPQPSISHQMRSIPGEAQPMRLFMKCILSSWLTILSQFISHSWNFQWILHKTMSFFSATNFFPIENCVLEDFFVWKKVDLLFYREKKWQDKNFT